MAQAAFFTNSERPQDDLQRWTKLKQICAGDLFVGLTVDGKVIAELGVLRYRLSKENWEDIQEIAVAKGTVAAVDTNGKVTVGIDREGKVFITGMDW